MPSYRSWNTSSCAIESVQLPKLCWPANFLARNVLGAKIAGRLNKHIVEADRDGSTLWLRICTGIKQVGLALLDTLPLLLSNKKLLRKVDGFHPDIIYTMGAAVVPLKISLFFAKRYDCGIVPHFMDNWRSTLYSDSIILAPFRKQLLYYLECVESKMQCGLVISPKMAIMYANESGRQYVALMNTSSHVPMTAPAQTRSGVVFTYAGGLHLGRWHTLRLVERCIARLRAQGHELSLVIYTKDLDRQHYNHKFCPATTEFREFLPHGRVAEAYADADVLLHIESFSEQMANFTKYSLSTKIPEYMAAGRPIICFAPAYLAVSEYIRETGVGYETTTEAEFEAAAILLVLSPKLRSELGFRAMKVAQENHSAPVSHEILRQTFLGGVKKGNVTKT